MRMVTLREFAQEHHVSYEAVRKSVVRYKAELEGHIISEKGSKRRYLDEEAQRILSDHRRENPITIVRESHSEKLAEQAAEIESLKKRIDFYKDELLQSQKQQIVLIEKQREYEAFLEDRDRLQAEHDKAISDREQMEQERDRAISDCEQLQQERDQVRADLEQIQAVTDTARAEAETAKAATEAARAEAAAAQADRDSAKAEAEAAQADLDRIQAEAEATKADLEKIRTELKSAQTAKEEAETEAGRYHKSWFGFYRKY